MVPADHLLDPAAGLLPAIVLTLGPAGMYHFVVAWRRHGRWVQVMDPAVGRRFVPVERFARELVTHEAALPAGAWAQVAAGPAQVARVERRLLAVGMSAARPPRR